VTFLGHTLQVVMTPSSMRLAEPRLSLVGTYHRPGMRWDTALEYLLVVPLGNDGLGGLDQYDRPGLAGKYP
jgi:hypothetical protein